jgi:hypothetical protein
LLVLRLMLALLWRLARTVFSVIIAELVGRNVKNLVSKEWGEAMRGVVKFIVLSFPASFINRFVVLLDTQVTPNRKAHRSETERECVCVCV